MKKNTRIVIIVLISVLILGALAFAGYKLYQHQCGGCVEGSSCNPLKGCSCPQECLNEGSCNPKSGECNCLDGWIGPDCSEKSSEDKTAALMSRTFPNKVKHKINNIMKNPFARIALKMACPNGFHSNGRLKGKIAMKMMEKIPGHMDEGMSFGTMLNVMNDACRN